MSNSLIDENDILAKVFNASPFITLIVDSERRILFFNKEAERLIGPNPERALGMTGGAAMNCIHSIMGADRKCGQAEQCQTCALKAIVLAATRGISTAKQKIKVDLMSGDYPKEFFALITATPLEYKNQKLVLVFLQNINELVQLTKLIPICANCKQIRNDQQIWEGVEQYFKEHTDADFSHSICPACQKKLYPEYI